MHALRILFNKIKNMVTKASQAWILINIQPAIQLIHFKNRESRGFGFVTFQKSEDAKDAIYYMDKTKIDGKEIRVEISRRAKAREPTPGRYLGKQIRERERKRFSRSRS
mmetsp:Transcript_4344/g.4111  ORF Transcript_4344/g.4111 Transcript_4344/m.4111 type:complete len:109 (+) Transcript_4344:386-712(+)